MIAAVLEGISAVSSFRITGKSETDKNKSRFYFRKKYMKYYMLEMFYGARKQVFFTFGPYVLILFYGADTSMISLLFAVSAIVSFFAAPVVGRIIDRLGYKTVMVADTLILVIVCFFYGFAHHLFPKDVAFIVCCVNYVLDAVISLASMDPIYTYRTYRTMRMRSRQRSRPAFRLTMLLPFLSHYSEAGSGTHSASNCCSFSRRCLAYATVHMRQRSSW